MQKGPAFLYLAITLLCVLCVFYLFFALRSSRALEKMQREYVDNISHELKSPIAAVKALAEPIYDGMVHDEESLRKYSGLGLAIAKEIAGGLNEKLWLEHSVPGDTAFSFTIISAR